MFSHSCGKYYIYNDPMTGLSQWIKRQTSQKNDSGMPPTGRQWSSQGMLPKVSAELLPQGQRWTDDGGGKLLAGVYPQHLLSNPRERPFPFSL